MDLVEDPSIHLLDTNVAQRNALLSHVYAIVVPHFILMVTMISYLLFAETAFLFGHVDRSMIVVYAFLATLLFVFPLQILPSFRRAFPFNHVLLLLASISASVFFSRFLLIAKHQFGSEFIEISIILFSTIMLSRVLWLFQSSVDIVSFRVFACNVLLVSFATALFYISNMLPLLSTHMLLISLLCTVVFDALQTQASRLVLQRLRANEVIDGAIFLLTVWVGLLLALFTIGLLALVFRAIARGGGGAGETASNAKAGQAAMRGGEMIAQRRVLKLDATDGISNSKLLWLAFFRDSQTPDQHPA